jgi:integrase
MARKRKPPRPPKPPRRARGSGTVSWDEKRQRWRAVHRSVTGQRTNRYFKEQGPAQAWLVEQDTPPAPPALTVEHALVELLASRDYLKDGTKTNYAIYMARIALTLGELPVNAVTPKHIEAMDREHRRILSGTVADQILTLLSTLYERLIALETPGVLRNPVRSYRTITPPRARVGTPPRPTVALDHGMCRLLLRAMADSPYQVPIAWLIVTGMRIGELRGLRWANVTASEIRIVEQRLRSDRHTPAPLKTETEIGQGRTIPTPAGLLAMTPRDGNDLVFPARDGGALAGDAIRLALNAGCKAAGIPRVHIHGLRHTAASGWAGLGCPEWFSGALLGHAPRSMTGEYTHISLDALRPYVDEWAQLVLGEPTAKPHKLFG